MTTLREARVPLNPDGSVNYYALQAEDRGNRLGARLREIDQGPDTRRDPYQAIIDRYAGQRAMIDEGSITQPYVPPMPSAREQTPTGLWTPEEMEESKAETKRLSAQANKPTTYATNIPETEAKWKKEGKKVTMVKDEAKVPAKPSEDDLLKNEMTNGMWDKVKASHPEWGGIDPLNVNAVDYATKKREVWDKEHPQPSETTMGGKPNLKYTNWVADRKQYFTEMLNEAKENKTQAMLEFKEVRRFVSDKDKIAEAKEAKVAAQQTKVAEAQRFTNEMLNDWRNFKLSPEEYARYSTLPMNERVPPTKFPLKDDILQSINDKRALAGMPPYSRKEIVTYMKQYLFNMWNVSGEGTPVTRYDYGTEGGGAQPAPAPAAKSPVVPVDPRAAKALKILQDRARQRGER